MSGLEVAPGPRGPGPVRPDGSRLAALVAALPSPPVTRFAPAPTGGLHLGHLVNAIFVWGVAQATGGRVLVRIEDHDGQRSRRQHEASILRDLERLGLEPDGPLLRQSDDPAPYGTAAEALRAQGRLYACTCARADLLAWRGRGPGCPAGCGRRAVPLDAPGSSLRADLGPGAEEVEDLLAGRIRGRPGADGDLTVRDRLGNWSYPHCVVVDDHRQGVTLVIRGRDLLEATPAQVRLAHLLGRPEPPAFLHHPLIRKASGAKLSKADGDTGVEELLDAGTRPADLLGMAAAAVGLIPGPHPITAARLGDLFI